MDKTKETYRLATTVAPGESNRLSRRLTDVGTLEQITVRIYVGAVLNLHIMPRLNKLHGRLMDVIDYTGKQFIDGDDDVYVFPVGIPVVVDNELIVDFVNLSATDTLDFAVDFVVDHSYLLGGLADGTV